MKFSPFYWIGYFWGLIVIPMQFGRTDAYWKLQGSSPLVAAQEALQQSAAVRGQGAANTLPGIH